MSCKEWPLLDNWQHTCFAKPAGVIPGTEQGVSAEHHQNGPNEIQTK